jgi:AcrR family transcriptional regulator
MRTPTGWVIPMPTCLVEGLASSLVVLAGETGLGAVTMRALARQARVSPGTLTHHFASKNELFALCTARVAQWFSYATDDYVEDRGAVGLFPEVTDETYRRLTSAWVQLRIHALTDPEVDARVHAMTGVLRRSAARALDEPEPVLSTTGWWLLEALREAVVRPRSQLTPGVALTALQEVVPTATRGPVIYD